MKKLSLVLVFFSGLALAESKGSVFSEPVKDSGGVQRCCLPIVRTCEEECGVSQKPNCSLECYKKFCITKKSCLEKTSSETSGTSPSLAPSANPTAIPEKEPEPPTEAADPQVKKPGQPTIRYDGALTGAGNVNFDLANADPKERRLRALGIIFAMTEEGSQVILKKTPAETIPGGSSEQLQLEVSEDEYTRWKEKYAEIRLGITYPEGFDSQGWEFENQLTEEDLKKARSGEFIIRGRFRKK
jgi:hypothetical protein